jgi:hypothetical protein
VIVSTVSALRFAGELAGDFPNLFNKSYLEKQDYVEGKYNRYLVFRYYAWLNDILKGKEYGLIVAETDKTSYDRYRHRLNYFLYPRYILSDSNVLFAPRLDNLGRTIMFKGRIYSLRYEKDNTGVFTAK